MNPHYEAVARRANRRCEYCHAPEELFNLQFEVDHIVPRSRKGSRRPENLALACRACNLFKSDYMTTDSPPIPPFNPRRHEWSEHFELDTETAELIGRSDIGRATVTLLRMNAPRQQAARRRWIALGLYP